MLAQEQVGLNRLILGRVSEEFSSNREDTVPPFSDVSSG